MTGQGFGYGYGYYGYGYYGFGYNGYGYNGYPRYPYSTKILTSQSPPQSFAEPLSIAEVKTFLKLPPRTPPDPNEDAELTALCVAARHQAEICQGRDLVVKQWDLCMDYWPSYFITLGAKLRSVDLVQFRDYLGEFTTMTEGTDYVIDMNKEPGIIVPPYNALWPVYTAWPTSSLLIRFTSGFDTDDQWWAADGQNVKQGMKMLVGEWFQKKLPFLTGGSAVQEYPYGLSCMLRQGAIINVI
jgi:uncharacterized phiE125 gp8 family phage protein